MFFLNLFCPRIFNIFVLLIFYFISTCFFVAGSSGAEAEVLVFEDPVSLIWVTAFIVFPIAVFILIEICKTKVQKMSILLKSSQKILKR